MNHKNYTLGTVEASEQLINDLYIDLRKKVNQWASITHQTAQARMGYIGQHLVSVATGYSGGRSGARGKDLILPNNEFAEIKTCYRVDQLGKCNNCGAAVSGIEAYCPECNSTNLKRNDDSKWLIGIRHDEEFATILEPKYYYLVLFEFTDLKLPDTIRASIWRVDPTVPGFAYCMIDYYKNIRAASHSKAPFNLWPFQLKFDLMKPILIYRSYVTKEDKVQTEIFPGRDAEKLNLLQPLFTYSQSQNLTQEKIVCFARSIGAEISPTDNKRRLLEHVQRFIDESNLNPDLVIDKLAEALYLPETQSYLKDLPHSLRERAGIYKI
ncbi:MAG: MamI family restriction endonuclease [Candidatus Competibacter sp.]|nr:MamI family restriction endonuclease [Candidatus Competibacter sp.]HRD49949.1 MamI family restriction endonuclease [Candidatus Contendobacter sp.]